MEFRILGPLEVCHENEVITIGGPRQQGVLAMLLLEANHVMSIERLIEAVWDEEPPNTARGQIQICISGLRKELAAAEKQQRILSRRPGYLIRCEDDALDLNVFEARVVAARQAVHENNLPQACASFDAALGLWRGPALVDVPSKLVQQSVAKLHERRLTVVEEYVVCGLRLGMHHDLISDLVGWVKEHPLRERLRALLMTALYQAGRQAEALEAYQDARNTLMEELALEPSRELQALQRAVLNGTPLAPELDVPASFLPPRIDTSHEPPQVPRLLPTAISDFTGRSSEVDYLVTQATQGGDAPEDHQAVQIGIIIGRGGAGKTTLAVHVAHKLAPNFPDGQLFAKLRSGDHQADPGNILERFLRVLGIPSTGIPVGIEERAEMYRNLLGTRRMLVVLDDAMSEQQIAPLLPGSSPCLVIVTSRKRLAGLAAASRVELHGFDRCSAVALLTKVVGAERVEAEPDAVSELCQLCGYLPFAVRIVAARLAARPHWSVSDLVGRLVDDSRCLDELDYGGTGVRASISLTYMSLSPDAQRLFRLLAVADAPSFASWVGSPLLQIDVASAEDLLEELTEAYLIDADRDGSTAPARYSFHEIMRPFAREQLVAEEPLPDRQKALERLMGALLYLAGEAHRYEYSGELMLPSSDASRWVLPDALVSRLMKDPLAWYETERLTLVSAVLQAAASGLAEHAWDLAQRTVTLFESHARYDDWHITHETALKAACRAGDLMGEAAMRYSLGSLYMFERQSEEASHQLAQASALYQQLGNRRGMALAQRNLAYLNRVAGNLDEALVRWEEALGTFELLGDHLAEAHILQNMAQVYLDFDDDAVAYDLLDRAATICKNSGNRRVGAQVLHRLGELYVRRGDLDLAAAAYRRVLTAVRKTDDQIGECHALLGLGSVYLRRGDLDAATITLASAHDLAGCVGEHMVRSRAAMVEAEVALRSGQLSAAADYCDQAIRGAQQLKAAMLRAEALLVRGRIHAAAGHPEAAFAAWHDSSALLSALDLRSTARLFSELRQRMAELTAGQQPADYMQS